MKRDRNRICWRCAAALWALLVVSGCGRSPLIGTQYGQSSGLAGDNIYGTTLFAQKFRDAGHRVTTARTLGRTIENSNVVVWFPDRMRLPSRSSCNFFERWLSSAPGRTLILVNRDYAADISYWRRMDDEVTADSSATPEERLRVKRWLARAMADQEASSETTNSAESCKWFTATPRSVARDADSLQGPWASYLKGVEYPPVVTQEMKLLGFAKENSKPLLKSGDDFLITEVKRPHWRGNRILLVANGSTFLNFPMVQDANQKLAEQLVGSCGPAGRTAFLQSGYNDPQVAGEPQSHYLLRVFTTPPLRSILMHLSVMGMIYCIAVFPIFGVPKRSRDKRRTDFGRHVLALGRLLAGAQNEDHAYASRREYFNKVQGTESVGDKPAPVAGSPFREGDTGDGHERYSPDDLDAVEKEEARHEG